jgi:hypothetical protein
MSSVATTLQGAVEAALRADTTLRALMGGTVRIYDTVPANFAFPYITHGSNQLVPELAEGLNGRDVFVELHVWSRPEPPSLGRREAADIAAAVETALCVDLVLAGFRLVDAVPEKTRIFDDTDGLTKHAVLTIRYITEPDA